MIAAANLARVSKDITPEHFPMESSGQTQLTMKLEAFDTAIRTRNVLIALANQGLCQASLAEALAFLEESPEMIFSETVVILGSCWTDERGNKWVPIIISGPGTDGRRERCLVLRGFRADSVWGSGFNCPYLFLAVVCE